MAKTPPVKKEKVVPTELEKAETVEAELEVKRIAAELAEKEAEDEVARLAAEEEETELPDAIDVIHKHSEKEFTVSRAYYLANKGNLRLA